MPRQIKKPSQSKRAWVLGISSIVLVLALLFFSVRRGIDWEKVYDSFRSFSLSYLSLAILMLAAQIGCQILRLWSLIPRNLFKLSEVARAFVYGQMLNAFAPARAGDGLKIVLLRKFAFRRTHDYPLASGVGALFADKIVDISAIVFLSLLSLPFWWEKQLGFSLSRISFGPVVVLLLGAGLLLWLCELLFPKFRLWLLSHWHSFQNGAASLGKLGPFFFSSLSGVSCWICEIFAIKILAENLGFTLGFSEVLWVLVVLNIGIAVPISVANVGAFEAAMAFGFSQVQVPGSVAIALASMHHLLQIITIFMLGAFSFFLSWRSERNGFQS